ncbi:MAG: pyridoxal phosphate-dependent aminotransferase [Deltaproteobacteria bacterium]|nr:pyridoxal phosphate-dependent aminotransferase [Deltaproteobacteria bacterium]
MPVAQRLSAVKPSATVAVAQRARELKAQGIDVLSFSVGEPDFDTPVHIREAAKKAIDSGATRYTAARGIPELREAICEASAKRRVGVTYEPSQVVVSVGAKHTLFNLALALYDEGDEVLIPAPYWVSYPEQVRLAGANPVIVQTTEEQGFRMTPEALRAAITPKTKALILCSPSNPTGSAYTGEQLRALADVAAEHNFWIIVDEIYGQLVYGGFEQKSIAEVAPDLKDRIIIVDGVSKTFAMTGWRIGWMLGPEYVTKACEKIQGQATTNPSSVAQHAAIAALQGPWEPMEEMRQAFEARRSIIVGGKKLETDVDVAGYLLEEARCAVVPGTAFGAPGFVRISYAASNEMIREGLGRMGEAVSKLT